MWKVLYQIQYHNILSIVTAYRVWQLFQLCGNLIERFPKKKHENLVFSATGIWVVVVKLFPAPFHILIKYLKIGDVQSNRFVWAICTIQMGADFPFYNTSMEFWLIFFSATALAKEKNQLENNEIPNVFELDKSCDIFIALTKTERASKSAPNIFMKCVFAVNGMVVWIVRKIYVNA